MGAGPVETNLFRRGREKDARGVNTINNVVAFFFPGILSDARRGIPKIPGSVALFLVVEKRSVGRVTDAFKTKNPNVNLSLKDDLLCCMD